jgi:putative membrane protein
MRNLANGFKGAAMGMAEVIPGVSGGTIAFITGIYEKLIHTIKEFDHVFIALLAKGDLKGAWKKVDGGFVALLLLGMMAGLVVGVLLISNLLESHPPVVWGFFFGLILASVFYIMRRVGKVDGLVILMVVIGSVAAWYITVLTPAEGSATYLGVFFAGSIAISALILPGVSGSFILLLMGMYTIILGETRNFIETRDFESLTLLIAFGAGALLGLVIFARFVSWLLKRYKRPVFGLLCGFMIGSLNKIWPWRDPVTFMDEHGNVFEVTAALDPSWRVIKETNRLPGEYLSGNPYTELTIVFLILGFALVLGMDLLDRKRFKSD